MTRTFSTGALPKDAVCSMTLGDSSGPTPNSFTRRVQVGGPPRPAINAVTVASNADSGPSVREQEGSNGYVRRSGSTSRYHITKCLTTA
jgi:hypothetical protein